MSNFEIVVNNTGIVNDKTFSNKSANQLGIVGYLSFNTDTSALNINLAIKITGSGYDPNIFDDETLEIIIFNGEDKVFSNQITNDEYLPITDGDSNAILSPNKEYTVTLFNPKNIFTYLGASYE